MKTEQIVQTVSIKAAAALATVRRFITFDGTYAGAGESALGVLAMNADLNEMAPVYTYGIVMVEAGAAVAQGAAVQSDADGKAITKTTEGVLLGYSLDVASAAGEIIKIKLI